MAILHSKQFPILHTERLILRCLKRSDAPAMYTLRTIPENQEFLDRPPTINEAAALAHIEKILEGTNMGIWINWAITTKSSDDLIGCIGFWNYHETLPHAHIGYELLPTYQGKGIMSEAMKRIMEHGEQVMEIKKVTAEINGKNARSKNLLKKFGFELEPPIEEETNSFEIWNRNSARKI